MKKAFISSVVRGMQELRDAADRGVRALGLEPVRSEQFGARPESSQRVCLEGVRQSDVMLLILGERYGDLQPSGISATHEEYLEARERVPVLVFVQKEVVREARQEELISEVRRWESGHSTESFTNSNDLQELVTKRLHQLDVVLAQTPLDSESMVRRCNELIPQSGREAQLALAVAVSPVQEIVRPAEIEDRAFADALMQAALFGNSRVLSPAKGTTPRVEGHTLTIAQDDAYFSISESGELAVVQPALSRLGEERHSQALIEEDLNDRIVSAIKFMAETIETVDGRARLADVCLGAALTNADYVPWFTREQVRQQPSSWAVGTGRQRSVVHLNPPVRKRAIMGMSAVQWGTDLLVLLRRDHNASI